MDKFEKLKTLKSNDLGLFNLKNKVAWGKVVKIYSTNKCQIIFGLNNLIFKFNCKLNKTQICKDSENCYLQEYVSNDDDISKNTKLIKIKCHQFDKEGFLLIDLFDNQLCINTKLIADKKLLTHNYDIEELFDFDSTD